MKKSGHKHVDQCEVLYIWLGNLDKYCRVLHKDTTDESVLLKIVAERKAEINNCLICKAALMYLESRQSGRGFGAIINKDDED